MSVGKNLKFYRQEANLTIPQLAENAGLSRGFISQVENDKASLSLESLEKIANVLKIPMRDFLANQSPPEFVPKHARLSIKTGNGPEMQVLSAAFGRQLQVLAVDLPPGYQTGNQAHAHDGEEFITVLEGKVKVVQGDFAAVLNEGDSVHLDGSYPHLCQNAQDKVTKIIVVVTPPSLLQLGKSDDSETSDE